MIQRESCEGSYVILFSKKFRPFLGGASSTKLDPVGLGTVCKTIWRHFCNFPRLLELLVFALFVFHKNVLALLVLYENVQDCSPFNFCVEKSWGSQRENIMGGDISVKVEGKERESHNNENTSFSLWIIGILSCFNLIDILHIVLNTNNNINIIVVDFKIWSLNLNIGVSPEPDFKYWIRGHQVVTRWSPIDHQVTFDTFITM